MSRRSSSRSRRIPRILDRRNAIQVLQGDRLPSPLRVWLSNGVFYLKYLAEEPTLNRRRSP